MLKKLMAATVALGLAVGLSLVATSPALAEGASNDASYYETPNTGEVCAKYTPSGDITTWSLSSVTLPAGMMWTKVIIKAGNTGASGQGPEDHGYYTNATYMYPAANTDLDWVQVSNLGTTTFSHPSNKNISHVIYCYAPAPATDVAGSASSTDQTCTDEALVGGVITVVITTGVTYVITDSSNTVVPFDGTTGKTGELAPGNYTVSVSASSSAYHLTSPASIALSIGSYVGECGQKLIDATPSASKTDQGCTVDSESPSLTDGFITVVITDGVTYTITDSSNNTVAFDATTGKTAGLAPGVYTVHPTALSGYTLTDSSDIVLTIAAYGDDCGVVLASVTPTASASNQDCSMTTEVPIVITVIDGYITVGIKAGVSYTITDASNNTVAFDSTTGKTGALAPGVYTVHPSALSGYVLTDSSDIVLTIAEYDHLKCFQEHTHGLVDPSSVQVQIGCNVAGSYTLSSDQQDGNAVTWTVNGSVVSQGTYYVSTPGHYVIDAAPGPGFGFATGTQHEWVYDFGYPKTCDLKTLALTGQDSGGVFLLAGFLALFGLACVRMSVRARRTAEL